MCAPTSAYLATSRSRSTPREEAVGFQLSALSPGTLPGRTILTAATAATRVTTPLRTALRQSGPAQAQDSHGSIASIDTIGRVASPVLVIAGDGDRIVPVDQSRRLFDAIRGPRALVIIEGADHNDLALLAGDQMMAAVGRFLSAI